MKVTLFVSKSVPENAAFYYEQAKRAKKKTSGAKEAIEKTKKEIKKGYKFNERVIRATKVKVSR